MRLYQAIADFTYKDFLYFTNTDNKVMQVLLGHFVALHAIAMPLILKEEAGSKDIVSFQKIFQWLNTIATSMDRSFHRFLEWPLTLIETMTVSLATKSMPHMSEGLMALKKPLYIDGIAG